MARRWIVSEAIIALREKNKNARIDIAERFPLFATATEEEILEYVDKMTVRQIEMRMKREMQIGKIVEVKKELKEEIKKEAGEGAIEEEVIEGKDIEDGEILLDEEDEEGEEDEDDLLKEDLADLFDNEEE